MAVQALKEKEQAELAKNSNNNPEAKMKTKCNVGDTLYVLTSDSLTCIEETKCSKITKVHLADIGDTIKYHAPCVYDDWGGATWEFYDNDFGVKVFLTRKDAEIARDMNGSNNAQIAPCKVGDVIPYQICSGRVIYYIVEKIKVKENGDLKIRCKHGSGGANRSFTAAQAQMLIGTNGKTCQ
jgi:hypothetical protein